MFTQVIWGALGVFGGVVLTLWLIGREDPPVAQALTNPQSFSLIDVDELADFAGKWQHLEERLEVSLGPDEAHHLLQVEEATKKRLRLVSMEDDNQKQQNRLNFVRWLVENGKLTDDTIVGPA